MRPLEPAYFTCWMDGIQVKIRHNGKVVNKCIYLLIGLKNDSLKDIPAMWINETESASFWLSVLNDLKARAVEDILIAYTDDLTGFTKMLAEVFPNTVTQLCVVQQIRNSCKYVSWKERKVFPPELKTIYGAVNRESALNALTDFGEKWAINMATQLTGGKTNGKL